jgi:hypothetical protein
MDAYNGQRAGYLTAGDELGRPDLRRDKQSSRAKVRT